VRFALSNTGDKIVYLDKVQLIFGPGNRFLTEQLVLDPTEDRVLHLELAEGVANVLAQGGRLPVEQWYLIPKFCGLPSVL
jgi:hypothetical protein